MDELYAQKFVRSLPYPYACCRYIYNGAGKNIDGEFIEVNSEFESYFNIRGTELAGNRISGFFSGYISDTNKLLQNKPKKNLAGTGGILCSGGGLSFSVDTLELDADDFVMIFHDIAKDTPVPPDHQPKIGAGVGFNIDFLLNSTLDYVFMAEYINGSFRHIYLNAAHEKLTGFHNEDVIGKTPEEVWGEETGKKLAASYFEAIKKDENQVFEETLNIEDRIYKFVTSLSVVTQEGHKYIVVSRKDITQYKLLEEHHHVLLRRLQSMFSEHIANMLIIEAVTGKNYRRQSFRMQFLRIQKERAADHEHQ